MADIQALQAQLDELRTTIQVQAQALQAAQTNETVTELQAQVLALQGQLQNQAETLEHLPAVASLF